MDEWIQWTGGRCPVNLGTLVEVKTRRLGDHTGPAGLFYWGIRGFAHDIIAYRIIDDDNKD